MKKPKHMIWTDDIYYMDEDAWLEGVDTVARYIWGWELPEDVKAVDYYNRTNEEQATAWYVNNALDKSVAEAECGWSGVCYSVTEDPCCGRREWAVMFANKDDTPREARWIPVTGCSKGAIAEAVWSLVFR